MASDKDAFLTEDSMTVLNSTIWSKPSKRNLALALRHGCPAAGGGAQRPWLKRRPTLTSLLEAGAQKKKYRLLRLFRADCLGFERSQGRLVDGVHEAIPKADAEAAKKARGSWRRTQVIACVIRLEV
jgi:hypothetical protein